MLKYVDLEVIRHQKCRQRVEVNCQVAEIRKKFREPRRAWSQRQSIINKLQVKSKQIPNFCQHLAWSINFSRSVVKSKKIKLGW
jgi:hypothetical protein